jgi:hypothetical protein
VFKPTKFYEFYIELKYVGYLTDEQLDLLYESGCDDATIGSSDGKVVLVFSRESTDLEKAIDSAISDIRKADPLYEIESVKVKLEV